MPQDSHIVTLPPLVDADCSASGRNGSSPSPTKALLQAGIDLGETRATAFDQILTEHFETVRVAKDGRRIDVSLTISPIRDRAGNVTGVSSVARDISERKRADLRLTAQLGRLSLLNRITRSFREVNPWVLDALLGTAFTVFGLIGLFGPRDAKFDWREPDAFAVLLSLGCSLPFYFRRRAPFATLLTCTVNANKDTQVQANFK